MISPSSSFSMLTTLIVRAASSWQRWSSAGSGLFISSSVCHSVSASAAIDARKAWKAFAIGRVFHPSHSSIKRSLGPLGDASVIRGSHGVLAHLLGLLHGLGGFSFR